MRASTAAVCAAVFASCIWCANVFAGEYHVYSCRMPDGQVAPADAWSEAVSQVNDATENTCASGGGLVAGLLTGTSHPADTDLATWTFGAPTNETISAATLWRAGDTAGGSNANASYLFWLSGSAGSEIGSRVFEKCVAANECTSKGNLTNKLAPENRVEVANSALHTPYLSITASCGSSIREFGCPAGGGDPNGYAAIIELFAADLTLADESPPAVSEVTGALAEDATVSGTSDVAFHASDAGSGIYEAVFKLDGVTVQSTVLNANGGHCRDVGQTSDGLPAFLYTQPCPAAASVDVPFDTTAAVDGTHHLVVEAIDAGGNSTPVLDRQVTVSNAAAPTEEGGSGGSSGGGGSGTGAEGTGGTGSGSGGAGQPPAGSQTGTTGGAFAGEARAVVPAPAARGAANGSEASDRATLTARWQESANAHVTSNFGRAHTVTGRLTDPAGRPIVGAEIDVSDLLAYPGAHASALRAPQTDAQGRWSVRAPRMIASGMLRFAYRSHLGDSLPAATRTLTLSVRAGLTLKVSPRRTSVGRRIRFSGQLHGGPIPPGGKQLVLEARSPRTGWIQFHVIRSDAAGRFRSSYRFHFPGPVRYSFRALSKYEADYPFLAGSSNTVAVLER